MRLPNNIVAGKPISAGNMNVAFEAIRQHDNMLRDIKGNVPPMEKPAFDELAYKIKNSNVFDVVRIPVEDGAGSHYFMKMGEMLVTSLYGKGSVRFCAGSTEINFTNDAFINHTEYFGVAKPSCRVPSCVVEELVRCGVSRKHAKLLVHNNFRKLNNRAFYACGKAKVFGATLNPVFDSASYSGTESNCCSNCCSNYLGRISVWHAYVVCGCNEDVWGSKVVAGMAKKFSQRIKYDATCIKSPVCGANRLYVCSYCAKAENAVGIPIFAVEFGEVENTVCKCGKQCKITNPTFCDIQQYHSGKYFKNLFGSYVCSIVEPLETTCSVWYNWTNCKTVPSECWCRLVSEGCIILPPPDSEQHEICVVRRSGTEYTKITNSFVWERTWWTGIGKTRTQWVSPGGGEPTYRCCNEFPILVDRESGTPNAQWNKSEIVCKTTCSQTEISAYAVFVDGSEYNPCKKEAKGIIDAMATYVPFQVYTEFKNDGTVQVGIKGGQVHWDKFKQSSLDGAKLDNCCSIKSELSVLERAWSGYKIERYCDVGRNLELDPAGETRYISVNALLLYNNVGNSKLLFNFNEAREDGAWGEVSELCGAQIPIAHWCGKVDWRYCGTGTKCVPAEYKCCEDKAPSEWYLEKSNGGQYWTGGFNLESQVGLIKSGILEDFKGCVKSVCVRQIEDLTVPSGWCTQEPTVESDTSFCSFVYQDF